MNQSDYLAQDAVGLAGLVAKKQVSAAEVLEAAIARMAEVNPQINAVILDLSDEARAQVVGGTPAGPLGGVPYLIKDITARMKGHPTTAGSRAFTQPEVVDSANVAGYRRAGLVLFGKTNTPEIGLEPVTEPERFGPSRNPWDLTRTPGGSSGGASAAVAAGIVPAAHASDGGGSIRIPASCTGLFGMKPTRGRVSMAPGNEGWGGFSIQHAVTRSVRDSAALLDAVCQPEPGDPYWAAPPPRPYLEEVGRDPGKLRIAFSDLAIATGRALADPECAKAARDAAALCASLGHDVEEASLPGDAAAASAAGGVVVAASVAATLENEAIRRGRPIEEAEVEAPTWGMYQRGMTVSAQEYVRALQAVHAFGRAAAALWSRYDVFLTSTLGRTALKVGELRGDPPDMDGYVARLFGFMPNTQAFNHSGQPAMSVPLAWSEAGLPIGIQFVGRGGDEATLFRLAGQLEQAQPWKDRRPTAFFGA